MLALFLVVFRRQVCIRLHSSSAQSKTRSIKNFHRSRGVPVFTFYAKNLLWTSKINTFFQRLVINCDHLVLTRTLVMWGLYGNRNVPYDFGCKIFWLVVWFAKLFHFVHLWDFGSFQCYEVLVTLLGSYFCADIFKVDGERWNWYNVDLFCRSLEVFCEQPSLFLLIASKSSSQISYLATVASFFSAFVSSVRCMYAD